MLACTKPSSAMEQPAKSQEQYFQAYVNTPTGAVTAPCTEARLVFANAAESGRMTSTATLVLRANLACTFITTLTFIRTSFVVAISLAGCSSHPLQTGRFHSQEREMVSASSRGNASAERDRIDRRARELEDDIIRLEKANQAYLAVARSLDSSSRASEVEWQIRNFQAIQSTTSLQRFSIQGIERVPSVKVQVPRAQATLADPSPADPKSALLAAALKGIQAGIQRVIGKDERETVRPLKPGTQSASVVTIEGAFDYFTARSAVGAFIEVGNIEEVPDGCLVKSSRYRLSEIGTTTRPRLCEGPDIAKSRFGAHSTGTLVAPNVVLTAAHVFSRSFSYAEAEANLATLKFAFGFQEPIVADEAAPVQPIHIRKALVYTPKRVLAMGRSVNQDWLLLELDQHVPPFNPAELAGSDGQLVGRSPVMLWAEMPSSGASVYALGHALGATLTEDRNRAVLKTFRSFFYVNLNNAQGGSGSPIFDTKHRVVGVVSRQGDLNTDTYLDGNFVINGPCSDERFVTNPAGGAIDYFDVAIGVSDVIQALTLNRN